MGLFDALRGRGNPETEPAVGPASADEAVTLSPAPGARYTAAGSTLTFGVGSASEVDEAGVRRSGQYTPAGRFMLSASLQPSVVITLTGPVGPDTREFTARRTDIGTRSTAELRYSRSD